MNNFIQQYPSLVRGAIDAFDCREVMRFLGRKQLNRFPDGEVTSDYGERYEGIRVKHVSQKSVVWPEYRHSVKGVRPQNTVMVFKRNTSIDSVQEKIIFEYPNLTN